MDVTRHNLVQVMPEIEKAIANCDFVAIDTELTGLRRDRAANLFDTREERYLKMKEASMGYSLIQFGLSCFKKREGDLAYDCWSYNFYIFPYKVNGFPKNQDRSFEVQASALSFLQNHGFDFNTLIQEGISWLNLTEEEACRDFFEKQDAASGSSAGAGNKQPLAVPSSVPAEHVDFIKDILEKVEQFHEDPKSTELNLDPCFAFRRKLIYESLRSSQYNDFMQVQTVPVAKNSRDCYLSITKIDKQLKKERQENVITEAVGFSNVIKAVKDHKKPLIGHNLILDLMHTVNQFVVPLPEEYSQFRELLRTLFPTIFDTKLIASSPQFKDIITNSALNEMYDRIHVAPFKSFQVEVKTGPTEGPSTANLHQAGFDSYITGRCFIALTEYLAQEKQAISKGVGSPVLKDFESKLNLTYTYDLQYLDIRGDEKKPDRSHVFYVTFPNEWAQNDLCQLFSAFGRIAIGWINGTSALVGLKDEAKWKEAKKCFQKLPTGIAYNVISYEDYLKRIKINSKTSTTDDNVKRKKSFEEISDKLTHEKAALAFNANKRTRGEGQEEKPFLEAKDW